MSAAEDYVGSIAEEWITLRGTHLLVSNAELDLIRQWREAGVPLRVVLRGMHDCMEATRAKPVSLYYCKGAVEQAFRQWRKALA